MEAVLRISVNKASRWPGADWERAGALIRCVLRRPLNGGLLLHKVRSRARAGIAIKFVRLFDQVLRRF